ncbi:MAG TPA: glycosyltransferase family 39 protein [Mycobacteriales bacterium]|nr:glycosyltransferase family 39 protein [Mycobacteriales bacterium]
MTAPSASAEPPPFARGPVLAITAALAALLAAVAAHYGYHRDELYFIASGRHLAWGYPDQPPLVPLIARVMTAIAPHSLVVLRLPSALLLAPLVVVTSALTARELGGGRGVQALTAGLVATGALVLGTGHILSTETVNFAGWGVILWLVVRILRTGRQRMWLAVGAVTGVALLATDLPVFLLAGIVVGLLVVGPRDSFRTPWLYAGGAIALALWAPYLVWQAHHGWPELTIARNIANGGSGTSAPRWQLVPFQLLLLSPFFAPIAVAGLVRRLRAPQLRTWRALGVAWIVLAVVFLVTGGKPYYLGNMLPFLVACGAPPAHAWAQRSRRRTGLLIASFVLAAPSFAITLPLVPVGALHRTPIVAANYDAGEMVGWPAMTRQIAKVYATVPDHAGVAIVASNYGEAGAVDRYGPELGLPHAYGVQNAYWLWGPPPGSPPTLLAIGFDRARIAPLCGSLTLAAHLDNGHDVDDAEQGAPVWICTDLTRPIAGAWRSLRDYG